MFESHSQIICTIFGIHIYFYGVILAFAILVGTFVSEYLSNKYFDFPKGVIIDLSPYLVFFGIIGARFYYCLLNYEFYFNFPTEVLAIRHGGISIHGAIIGGLIGLIIFARRKKFSFFRLADISSLGLALGQGIGRWGNFFNSEAFGRPTDLPWKLYIAPQYRPIPYQDYEYFHPTFLYESLLDFAIFGVLFYIVKSKKITKEGNLALIYLILYSIVRIMVEHIRIDSVCHINGVPIAIVVSLFIMIISFMMLVWRNFLVKD